MRLRYTRTQHRAIMATAPTALADNTVVVDRQTGDAILIGY
jgi:hypothetical protein